MKTGHRMQAVIAIMIFHLLADGVLGHRECCPDKNCKKYRGLQNVTRSGLKCQRWDRDRPIERMYPIRVMEADPKTRNEVGLINNYCRTPYKRDQKPWCYIDSKIWTGSRFEDCGIPWCGEGCCWEDKCKDYRGNLAVTVSGRKCQRWDSDKPHRRNNDVKEAVKNNKAALTSNYCRNPTNGKTVWCYTDDPQKRWEYCDIRRCKKDSCELSLCSRDGGICKELIEGGTTCTCKKGWKGENCDQYEPNSN